MERGDISNAVTPCVLFVFEGLVARIPDRAAAARERLYVRLHRWDAAVRCWQIDDYVVRHLWDVQMRRNYRVELVTFKGPLFGEALEAHLDRHDVPYNSLLVTTPQKLGRRLAYMPDVIRVVDTESSRRLMYGPKGVIVRDRTSFDPLA